MKRVRVIYNPSSGRQVIERKLDNIVKILIDEGYTVSKFTTKKKHDAMYETIKCCKEDWDIIIACGGDGTINEVAKGIVKGGRKIPVAILACGTVNDFATYLDLPRSSNEFCEMLFNGKTLDVDLGKVEDEYFVNVAASGLLTNVGYQVQPEAKAVFGRMAYYIEGIKELPKQKFKPIRVKFDSKEYSQEEDILLFLISNSSSIGGFKMLAPEAQVSDGYLDSVIIKKSEIQDLWSIYTNMHRGEHVNHPNVEYFQTQKIEIMTEEDVSIDIDGEYGGKLPATFEVIPHGFRIFIR